MTSDCLAYLHSEVLLYTKYLPPNPKFGSVALYLQPFWRHGCLNSEMHRMTPWWPWHLKVSQTYPVHTECLPLRPKFSSVSLQDQSFSRYMVVENPKFWMRAEMHQTNHEHFIVKVSCIYQVNTLYIPSKYLVYTK